MPISASGGQPERQSMRCAGPRMRRASAATKSAAITMPAAVTMRATMRSVAQPRSCRTMDQTLASSGINRADHTTMAAKASSAVIPTAGESRARRMLAT
jgi:hypothetical protein